jgi:hypothetical protein
VRNRGELAEGWYDPLTLQKAIASYEEQEGDSRNQNFGRGLASGDPVAQKTPKDESRGPGSDSDDSIGPTLPGQDSRSGGKRVGPSIPNMQDLELKRGPTTLMQLIRETLNNVLIITFRNGG